ncbi:DUF3347 domain-containing protein [Pedobacter montanisoli]|uniref:DUF3347 domain-containing protein n=1 Tax=Pedobacter montanisoli TaxID=2923277 RepID=A0ABS9ZT60_9SPHI|nr:DUF3347 domain-containing protein [Pedobacter montanisoli]MCJ0741776.1 DUF3347 domain-containing protein [Pedobacter montanisoli]
MKKIFYLVALFVITGLNVNAQSVGAKREFNNALKAYFETKNALTKDNATEAGAGAQKLLTVVNEFPVKTLSATQQADWNKVNGELKKSLQPMLAETDLKAQRKNFDGVASSMIKLVKNLNLNNEEVYVQYCPMAKKSWLNEVKPVQNPFFGSKMFDCGEVTETIAKK